MQNSQQILDTNSSEKPASLIAILGTNSAACVLALMLAQKGLNVEMLDQPDSTSA